MTERFFQSPEVIDIPDDIPLVFLEGPVQGAPDWQTPFARRLLEASPDIAVAIPRALPGHEKNLQSKDPLVKESALDRQIAYELLARRRAFQFGSVTLWYAAQDPSIPYPEGRVYGKTSEKEDSEVWGLMVAHPDHPFVVGYEPGFRGRPKNDKDYGNRNHSLIEIPEHDSLDDVFNATIDAISYTKRVGPRPIPVLTSLSIRRALDQLRSE